MTHLAYHHLRPAYGDIHNHCGISYGHGPLKDALANARERLDFVSITGHAHWPDMPEANERIQHIIDFHLKGFEKLKGGWNEMMAELRQADEDGRFVVFPAFEVHFCACGDRNVLYKDLGGEILYPTGIEDLHRHLRQLRAEGVETLCQPHHIGYKKGTRGMDWLSHDPALEPLVELLSMHGCSEESDNTRPFLHVMGPSDWEGTLQYGLKNGHIVGITGGTDHHSGHPGSYGHGLTGVWAADGSREAIWEAFFQRRTWAMTGDKIELRFSINDSPIGAVIPPRGKRHILVEVAAAGAIDYVDVIKNNRLLCRMSECDVIPQAPGQTVHTKLYLEVGWGPRGETHRWEAELGIGSGAILGLDPRFRGMQVVSPLEGTGEHASFYQSKITGRTETSVSFETVSEGTPNNFTSTSQGVCLEVEMPVDETVYAVLNGQRIEWRLRDLLEGARSGLVGGLESHAYRMNRAPMPHDWRYRLEYEDHEGREGDYYYARVRQKNDQWAWSSPIFCRDL